MDREQAKELQQKLCDLFREYDVHVSVGINARGIVLRSQDGRVEATMM